MSQPWATLVALGAKTIETRSWSSSYRGELVIHASKGFPRDYQEMCATEPFLSVLKAAGFTNTNQLPVGLVVGVVWVTNVKPTTYYVPGHGHPSNIGSQEEAFGNYEAGRFGWEFTCTRAVKEPFPASHLARDGTIRQGGTLGLWRVPQSVIDKIRTEEF